MGHPTIALQADALRPEGPGVQVLWAGCMGCTMGTPSGCPLRILYKLPCARAHTGTHMYAGTCTRGTHTVRPAAPAAIRCSLLVLHQCIILGQHHRRPPLPGSPTDGGVRWPPAINCLCPCKSKREQWHALELARMCVSVCMHVCMLCACAGACAFVCVCMRMLACAWALYMPSRQQVNQEAGVLCAKWREHG